MKNYFYSNLSALNNDLNYAVDAADSLTGYAQTSALTAYATTESLTAYAQLSDVTGGGNLSACLSSSEFDTIDPLSGEITTYALSDYIEKLNTVIYTLRRITGPEPPPPTEREMTRFFYTNGTSADVDIVGIVPYEAYRRDTSIKSIEFGSHCTGIGVAAFKDCTQLTGVTFSSTMTVLCGDALNTTRLQGDIVVPGHITKLGYGVFRDITNGNGIDSIVFEEGLQEVGASTLYQSNPKYVRIPSTLKDLNNEFMYGCTNSLSLDIPANSQLTAIGSYSLYACYKLNSLTLPSTLVSIGNKAFDRYGNQSSANITFAGKTMAQVQAMSNYPWGARSGIQFICTDGTITI